MIVRVPILDIALASGLDVDQRAEDSRLQRGAEAPRCDASGLYAQSRLQSDAEMRRAARRCRLPRWSTTTRRDRRPPLRLGSRSLRLIKWGRAVDRRRSSGRRGHRVGARRKMGKFVAVQLVGRIVGDRTPPLIVTMPNGRSCMHGCGMALARRRWLPPALMLTVADGRVLRRGCNMALSGRGSLPPALLLAMHRGGRGACRLRPNRRRKGENGRNRCTVDQVLHFNAAPL